MYKVLMIGATFMVVVGVPVVVWLTKLVWPPTPEEEEDSPRGEGSEQADR